MKMLRCLGIFLASSLLMIAPSRADTDVTAFLNSKLASAPAVKYHRDVTTTKQVCHHYHMNQNADGGDSWDCHDESTTTRQDYAGSATVANYKIVEVQGLTFDYGKAVSLPYKALLQRREFANCLSNATVTGSQTASVAGTEGYSVTKTNGVSATVGASTTMTASYMPAGIGGSSSMTFNFSATVSTSTATTESRSETVTRSETWTVTVPGKTIGYLQMVAYQESVDIPFSASIIVDASLTANDSGLNQASQMLSEHERTVPFQGTLHLEGVSDGQFTTGTLPGHPACDKAGTDDLIVTAKNFEIPAEATEVNRFLSPNGDADAAAEQMAKSQMKPVSSKDFLDVLSKAATQAVKPLADGDTIGSPNGIVEQILYTVPSFQPAPGECGFNDLGVPNVGKFIGEARRFMNYVNGALVNQWEDMIYKFDQCVSA